MNELQLLVCSAILGLSQIAIAAGASVGQRGLLWATGSRDEPVKPLRDVAARLDRARGNFLETFPIFAALVIAVIALGRQDATSATGAQLYFWARLAYLPLYAAGVPYLRTLAWTVSVVGIVMLLVPML